MDSTSAAGLPPANPDSGLWFPAPKTETGGHHCAPHESRPESNWGLPLGAPPNRQRQTPGEPHSDWDSRNVSLGRPAR